MKGFRALLEISKWLYGILVGGVICLFLCLLLDVFGYWVGGGWNVLLGAWPVFTSTIAAVLYGSWGTILCLLIGFAVIARIILWDSTPTVLLALWQQDEEESV
jgi:hypothetical protein